MSEWQTRALRELDQFASTHLTGFAGAVIKSVAKFTGIGELISDPYYTCGGARLRN